MIAPFVLRRKKIHVLKDLPSKVERVVFCDLSSEQQALYDRIMSSNALQIVLGESNGDGMGGRDLDPIELDSMDPKAKAKALKKASGKQTAATKKAANEQFANMLMQLRKAALHPMLFREKYSNGILKKMANMCTREVEFCDSNIDYIEEDMSVMTDFELHRFCLQYKVRAKIVFIRVYYSFRTGANLCKFSNCVERTQVCSPRRSMDGRRQGARAGATTANLDQQG